MAKVSITEEELKIAIFEFFERNYNEFIGSKLGPSSVQFDYQYDTYTEQSTIVGATIDLDPK